MDDEPNCNVFGGFCLGDGKGEEEEKLVRMSSLKENCLGGKL